MPHFPPQMPGKISNHTSRPYAVPDMGKLSDSRRKDKVPLTPRKRGTKRKGLPTISLASYEVPVEERLFPGAKERAQAELILAAMLGHA